MLDVLTHLSGGDALAWRGSITVWGSETGAQWRLYLNDDKGNKIVSTVDQNDGALQGEYLHMTYGRLLVLAPSEVES